MNTVYHEAIKMTPYQAVFGQAARVGLTSNTARGFLEKLTPGILEEDLEDMLSQAPEELQNDSTHISDPSEVS